MTTQQINNMKMIFDSSYGMRDVELIFLMGGYVRVGCRRVDIGFTNERGVGVDSKIQEIDRKMEEIGVTVNCDYSHKYFRIERRCAHGYELYHGIQIVPNDEEAVLYGVKDLVEIGCSKHGIHKFVSKTKFGYLNKHVHRYCVENGIE